MQAVTADLGFTEIKLSMKRITFAAALFITISALVACNNGANTCNLIPAKILRYDCDRIIFQLLTKEQIGDADWKDVQTGVHYANVVSYYNTCGIGKITGGKKDTLYVMVKKTTENLHNGDCMQCLLSSVDPPQTRVDFAKISKIDCPE